MVVNLSLIYIITLLLERKSSIEKSLEQ